jgi:hypothetical protein
MQNAVSGDRVFARIPLLEAASVERAERAQDDGGQLDASTLLSEEDYRELLEALELDQRD